MANQGIIRRLRTQEELISPKLGYAEIVYDLSSNLSKKLQSTLSVWILACT